VKPAPTVVDAAFTASANGSVWALAAAGGTVYGRCSNSVNSARAIGWHARRGRRALDTFVLSMTGGSSPRSARCS
jgi:hypothetical protein